MQTLAERAEIALRMVREAPVIAYDVETSGLDWKVNWPVGYVVTVAKDSIYVPLRHAAGGNFIGCLPLVSPTGPFEVHRFELALQEAFLARRALGHLTVGHNLNFDMHFSANADIYLGRNCECTQNNEAMIDEFTKSFSLEACARSHKVTEKLGDDLYRLLAERFGGAPDRKQMEHFWRLPGNEPLAVDYSEGDGVSTYELWASQQKFIADDELGTIHWIESRLIWTIFKMERKGMRVDVSRIEAVRAQIAQQVEEAKMLLPEGFNVRSGPQVKELMDGARHTNYSLTALGNPSFTEKWLKKNPEGRAIVRLRKLSNLDNSFLAPLAERHVYNGRVHCQLNQLKGDEYGTITGRFSSSRPNMQQVPKRDKELGPLYRSIFIPDDGMEFVEADYSQCLAAGTQIMVPGGTKSIEDMAVGDWVYSYDAERRLVLRKVTWAGQTGIRSLIRAYWKANGRTEGYIDLTNDHRVRLSMGEYSSIEDLRRTPKRKGRVWVSVLALRRTIQTARGYKTPYMFSTGVHRVKESRFVFEQVNGWFPDEVHHRDENTLNNRPENLEGLSFKEHKTKHMAWGMERLTPDQRVARSRIATAGLLKKHNHALVKFEDLPGTHPVYDITVEDTHNFIANEICVHNCEPRLFAHFSEEPALIDGYNANPPLDMHDVVARNFEVERDPTAKRMNMGILTGMQVNTFAAHMGWGKDEAQAQFDAWFRLFPGIRQFQDSATTRFAARGWVKTLLGRRARLESRRYAYRGVSRVIQGNNADIIKYKLLECDEWIEREGLEDIIQLLLTVHDSIAFQNMMTPEGRAAAQEIVRMCCDVQGPPFNLKVPFIMDVGRGPDWGEATYGDKNKEFD